SSPGAVEVSVLIPTRERPGLLHSCLSSILANDHDSFEFVVVDQSAELSPIPEDERVRLFHTRTRGKSAALNEAISRASGRFFASTDADCTVSADWLRRGQALLEANDRASLVYGALLAIPHNPAQCFIPTFQPARLESVSGTARARLRGGAGANMFARRELF